MANPSRQMKRKQARERQKQMQKRQKAAQPGQAQMTEASLWQRKYDEKVSEVQAISATVAQQEAIIAAIILDNTEEGKANITQDTIDFISEGGVAGFKKEPLEEGGLTIEVIISDDFEDEIEPDTAEDEEE